MSGKPWTAEELEIVRCDYLTVPAAELAERLGRGKSGVYQQATRLGVARRRIPINMLLVYWIGERAREGWCNPCIARAWSAKWPGCLPIDRNTIAELRAKHRLPASPGLLCSQCRGAGVRAQRLTLGIESAGQLRALALRQRVRRSGWPDCLLWRQTQILDALAERGPMTRREIAAAIGYPWRGKKTFHTKYLAGGSCLANLMQLGLVLKLPGRPVAGKGRGSSHCVYSLALDALDYRKEPRRERTG